MNTTPGSRQESLGARATYHRFDWPRRLDTGQSLPPWPRRYMAQKAPSVVLRIKGAIYSHIETKDTKLLRDLRKLYTFDEEGSNFTRKALVHRAKTQGPPRLCQLPYDFPLFSLSRCTRPEHSHDRHSRRGLRRTRCPPALHGRCSGSSCPPIDLIFVVCCALRPVDHGSTECQWRSTM